MNQTVGSRRTVHDGDLLTDTSDTDDSLVNSIQFNSIQKYLFQYKNSSYTKSMNNNTYKKYWKGEYWKLVLIGVSPSPQPHPHSLLPTKVEKQKKKLRKKLLSQIIILIISNIYIWRQMGTGTLNILVIHWLKLKYKIYEWICLETTWVNNCQHKTFLTLHEILLVRRFDEANSTVINSTWSHHTTATL